MRLFGLAVVGQRKSGKRIHGLPIVLCVRRQTLAKQSRGCYIIRSNGRLPLPLQEGLVTEQTIGRCLALARCLEPRMTGIPKRKSSALHVRLDDDLANYIGREAQRLRVSQSDVVRMTLSERFEREAERTADV